MGRDFEKKHKKNAYLMNTLANRFLAILTNILYASKITDMETGSKVFRKKVIEKLTLKYRRVESEPEIIAKVLESGYKIYELPIDYFPRTFEQGKEIGFKDGLQAIWILFKYRFVE